MLWLAPPVAVLILLLASFLKELDLLAQGGPTGDFVWLGALGLLGGGILAIGTSTSRPAQFWRAAPAMLTLPSVRSAGLAGVAVLLSLGAAFMVHAGGSPTLATIAWAGGLILILLAAAPADSWARLSAASAAMGKLGLTRFWPLFAVLGLVLIAALLRLPALDTIPGYVHNDEASNGLQARAIAQGQVPSLFGNGWANLPFLGFAWDAMFFKVFGDSLFALRLSSAALGIASVAVLALLGKELFGPRAGLISGTILAFSHVAIHFSRVGHHYIQAMFAVTLTLYLFTLAFRSRSPLAAAAAGILISVDIQVYYAGRVAYVIVPLAILCILLMSGRAELRSHLIVIAWMFVGWVVGVAPIGAVILGDWSAFMSRTKDVMVLGGTSDAQGHVYSVYGTHDAFAILRLQLWHVVRTFNYAGDTSLQYGSPHPMLDPVCAALFPSAVVYAVLRSRRASFAIAVIALMAVLVVGGVLTIDAAFWPRLIVLPPLMALLLGVFLADLWQALARTRLLLVPVSFALLALLAAVGWGNYQWYFNEYQPAVQHSYGSAAPMDIGNYLRGIPGDPAVYGITDGGPYVDHEAVRLLAPHAHICNVLQGIALTSCPPMPQHNRVFIITHARIGLIGQIEATYPGGTLVLLKRYADGTQIYAYRMVK